MNSRVQEVVFDNLDNEQANGYAHDFDKPARDYVFEMIEYSGTPDVEEGTVEFEAAVDAVLYWRCANA